MAASSSSGPGWKYHVFINFRGEDTRRGFVSHLYNALVKKSIKAFIDAEMLRKGDHLSELLTAIRESRLSIVVFSENYASSTWCLKELVQILECKDTNNQIVLPIFYEVDPSDVRKLKRSFAEAFAQHDRDSNAEMEDVRSWRSALTTATSLSGWVSRKYENDVVLIEKIVEDVYRKLINISSTSSKDNGLVDMDSNMHEMHLLLPGAVYDERIRAKNYKDKVLRWQKIPADQRAHLLREIQEHLQMLRIENSMGSSEPTPKQISYLQSLGCTVAPMSCLHASKLIQQYLIQNKLL